MVAFLMIGFEYFGDPVSFLKEDILNGDNLTLSLGEVLFLSLGEEFH
jgi:hypothetical protein